MLLRGKVALITGSASGIGKATARLFAKEGATVICTDINDTLGTKTVDEINAETRCASYLHMDVRSSQDIRNVAAVLGENDGMINILFNNAGRSEKQSFEATTEETWQEMLSTNLTGVFLTSKYMLPLMKRAGAGAIINHASVDGTLGNPAIAAYSAAKGGLLPLTHVMAHDLGKYKIRVNCISSGGIGTERAARQGGPAMTYQSRTALTPLQRRGAPAEVAGVALFLASDLASFVSGANLTVDGGRTSITQGTYHGYD